MDLSRAKTILIVAFLMLNAFLGYRLWLSPQSLRAGGSLTGDEVERLRELLQSNGYEIATAIPRQIPRLALLHVARLPRRDSSLVRTFRFDGAPRTPREDGGSLYAREGESLEIAQNGHVVYRNHNRSGLGLGEETRTQAERYLREMGLWQDDLKIDLNALRDPRGGTRFRYVQTYQGFPLFFCSVEVLLLDGIIVEVSMYQVAPLGFSEREITVISALEAVETFVEQARSLSDRRIVDISLGYYSQDYDAERWEIAPVWRIAVADGTAFYVNAFTGEAETSDL